ncbi:MAG: SprB repeat-containing protein, partial [Bacteroidota bacterium]
SVTINVTGGSGSYNYSWASGTDTQTGLAAGTYAVTVSENGGDGCELEVVFTLRNDAETAPISLSANEIELDCAGDGNGTVAFTVNYDPGFTGPADTIISNGVDQFENGTLVPGNYCIYIQDGANCIAGEACFSVSQPDSLYLILVKTDACGDGGEVSLLAAGGTGPFSFDWNDITGADNTPQRSTLTPGNYDLVLTDDNGCAVSETVTIDPCACDPAELISISIIEPTCGNSDGSATIKLAQNEGDYSYNWSPDLGMSNALDNMRGSLPFGNYTVTITRTGATDCDVVIDFLIENTDGPVATVDSLGAATCSAADGFARLLPATYAYNWSDGGNGAERSNLTSGTYYVTFSDPADPACENILELEIEENNPLEASVTVNSNPACGASDGSVTLTVTGGSGSYNYSWPSGTDTQTGLTGGPVNVTVTDNAGAGCVLDFNFVLPNIETSTVTLTTDTVAISCAGANDGTIDYTVSYDVGFAAPADTILTNSNGDVVQNGALAAGNYCLRIEDDNGCVTGGECFTVVDPDSLYFVFVIETACDDMGSIDVTVNGGTPPFTYDWADIMGTDDVEDRTNLAEAGYSLSVLDANGCGLTDDFINVPACSDSCDYFFGLDTTMVDACSGIGQLCFDINLPDTNQYNILIDGAPYTGNFGSCFVTSGAYSYAELFGEGDLGPYEVTGWMVDDTTYTGAFADIEALVDSMNTWDSTGMWVLDTSLLVISGGDPAKTYGSINTLQPTVNAPSTLAFNSRLMPLGVFLELTEGEYEIEITSVLTGCSNSVVAQVFCDGAQDIVDTIFVTESVTHCIDTSTLAIEADVASITNVCPELGGESVEFTIDESTFCVTYDGVRLGTDTACIEVCDVLGNCDTVNYFITIVNLPPDLVVDTIFVNETVEYCIDTSIFTSPITRFENFCPEEGTGFVDFVLNPDTYCVEYTGLQFGQKDTACVVLCDSLGFC